MKLYHTSESEIRNPDIYYGRKNADFGQGFYLTPDKEFTYRWAKKDSYVNIYELDETGLNIHRLNRNEEWFNYIFNNRRVKDGLDVDLVIGPIANDTIFDTLGVITSGFLKPKEAMELLMVGPEYTQVAIKSEKALANLSFIKSERITRLDDKIREQEALEYQKEFTKRMEMLFPDE
ncbi:MAG: DUF3990 domain-containing protein [Lachnospiraceae bacterium]|nr:DUF3990 domain-containing protein [Lachnospiraceae bacterium]